MIHILYHTKVGHSSNISPTLYKSTYGSNKPPFYQEQKKLIRVLFKSKLHLIDKQLLSFTLIYKKKKCVYTCSSNNSKSKKDTRKIKSVKEYITQNKTPVPI